MRDFDDAALELRVRAVLKEHLGGLPLDLTAEALDRRREAKRARRFGRGRGVTLLAAAALLLVGGTLAAGSGLLQLPWVVTPAPKPPVIADSSGSPEASARPIPVAGAGGVWLPTGSMGTPRTDPDAVRLLDGRVLVVGGSGGELDPPTAELYDPVSGTWSATGSMLNPRGGFGPVVLLDGRVLVGDVVDGSNGNPDVYGSELYDPATGTWSAAGNMIGSWGGPAVVLPDGTVLAHESLFDPASGTWAPTGKRNHQGTSDGAAIVLPDGTVLVAGGYGDYDGSEDPSFAFTDAAEIYDPATGSWTEIASMHEPTLPAMATVLPDGTALVVPRYGSWEIYDPATGTWTALDEPIGFTDAHVVLSDGTVLMTDPDETAPGPGPGAPCMNAALYDARTGSLTTASSMLRCADGSSFTLLSDGTVLVAGGRDCNGDGVCLSNGSAALYVPAGVPLPALPAFPTPAPPVFPDPTPVPSRRTRGAGPSRSRTPAPSPRRCSWPMTRCSSWGPRLRTWSRPVPRWR